MVTQLPELLALPLARRDGRVEHGARRQRSFQQVGQPVRHRRGLVGADEFGQNVPGCLRGYTNDRMRTFVPK